jgi:hypothetical protein
MKPALTVALALALAAGAALPTLAQDRADIDRTQIIGNRELPKVLYIVPWKKPLPGQLSGRPVQSVLDEALAPVDRQVFRRQVVYNTQVQSREAPAAAPSAQPGAAPTSTPAPAPAAPPPTAPR